jgi:parallel beta-helix repeat protein
MISSLKSRNIILNVLFIHLIVVLISISCSSRKHSNPLDPHYNGKTYNITGYVQKGPFISGSKITIQELNESLNPIGTSYQTVTDNDFGHYIPGNQFNTKYIQAIAEGYYFNEVQGVLSAGELTLRAVTDLSTIDSVNINVLTTLSESRIRHLVLNEGKSFSEARAQAEREMLNIFGISDSTVLNFDHMDISQQGNSHGILLAVSAILQGDNTVAELSELLSKISQDIEQDGMLNNTAYITEIRTNAKELSLVDIKQNIEKRYAELGLSITIPGFEDYVEDIWSNKAPNCSITTPDNGSVFTRGDTVFISIDADDSDGTISVVQILIDNTVVLSDSTAPYSFLWNTSDVSLGDHTIKSVAIDDDGKETSDELDVILETLEPFCQITAPQNGVTLTRDNPVNIEVDASDSDGNIFAVTFFIDDIAKHTDTSSPFSYSWDLTDESVGAHTIKAVATDNDGKETSDEITVSIDHLLPSCSITSPIDGGTYTTDSLITIQVTASDNDGYVQSVTFFLDDSTLFVDTESPYEYEWNADGISGGSHIIKAVAIDNDTNEFPNQITIYIQYLSPLCIIASPQDGASYTRLDTIDITVDASDPDGEIQSVTFFIDDVNTWIDLSSPYQYTWNLIDFNSGLYVIKATAKDNHNNTSSAQISITIEAIPPSCEITSPGQDTTFIDGEEVQITVDAWDTDGVIQNVNFYIDDLLVSTDNTSPYQYIWNTTGVGGRVHTIRAEAVDDDGEISYDQITMTYFGTVILISPENGSQTNNQEPVFIWEQYDIAEFYHFILSANIDLSDPVVDQTGISETEFTLQNELPATESTTYYWGVAAIDSSGREGKLSTVWTFELDTEAPAGTVVINNDDERTSSIIVDLTISSNEQHEMYISKDGSFTDGIWEDYTTLKTMTFSEYVDIENVMIKTYVRFRDVIGNTSSSIGDSIELMRTFVPGGIIDQDTHWTFENSAYFVQNDLLVQTGATLTIDPGVDVKFYADTYIRIEGIIDARGNLDNRIRFTSINDSPDKGDWQGLILRGTTVTLDPDSNYISGSILENCQIDYGTIGVQLDGGSTVLIDSCNINNHSYWGIYMTESSNNSVIRNNIISNNKYGILAKYTCQYTHIINNEIIYNQHWGIDFSSGDGHQNNNFFYNNTIAFNGSGLSGGNIYTDNGFYNNTIKANKIYNNSQGMRITQYNNDIVENEIHHNIIGLFFQQGHNNSIISNQIYDNSSWAVQLNEDSYENIFEYNTINNNYSGIYVSNNVRPSPDCIIRHNDIYDNQDVAIQIDTAPQGEIQYNNIYDNLGEYIFINNTDSMITAENNWWGTTDDAQIQQLIFDNYDDLDKGKVDYRPYENSEVVH